MKRILIIASIIFFFSNSVFPLQLKKIREIKREYLSDIGEFSISLFPGIKNKILRTKLGFLLIDVYGKIIKAFTDLSRGIFFDYKKKYLCIRKKHRIERYDLNKNGKRISNTNLDEALDGSLSHVSFINFLDREYCLNFRSFLSKTKKGRIWKRYLYIYSRLNGENKYKLLKKHRVGFYIGMLTATKYGILICTFPPYNKVAFNGNGDFYGCVYLLGYNGDIISNYRFYGKRPGSQSVFFYKGDFIYLAYMDDYIPDRNQSWIVKFDIKNWKPQKTLKINSTISAEFYPYITPQFYDNSFDFIIITESGKIYKIDNNLNIIFASDIGIKINVSNSYKRRITLACSPFFRTKNFMLVFIRKHFTTYDPMAKPKTKTKDQKLIVLGNNGEIIYSKSFLPEEKVLTTLYDEKLNIITFFKKGKVKVYKIIL